MSAEADGARGRSVRKSATAYRTISEVSEELAVPQHVLRFWETKFSQVRPLKRGGGRRYYRPEDLQLLRHIQTLLYKDGYTIKGVQRLLREGRGDTAEPQPVENGEAAEPLHPPSGPGAKAAPAEAAAGAPAQPAGALPERARAELSALLEDLRQLRAALITDPDL